MQTPKTDLVRDYLYSVSNEISLDLKARFFLVTYKINSLIALHSQNQIPVIPAP